MVFFKYLIFTISEKCWEVSMTSVSLRFGSYYEVEEVFILNNGKLGRNSNLDLKSGEENLRVDYVKLLNWWKLERLNWD